MTNKFSRRVAEIGELIDEATFDPKGWDDALDAMHRLMPETQIVLHTRDSLAPGTTPVLLRGWDMTHIASYTQHYAALNPWVPIMAEAPLMVPVWTEDTLPSSSFENTEFYTDWLRGAGNALSATGLKLFQESGRNASIDLHYSIRHNEAHHRDARKLLSAIAPRLRRSIAAARVFHPTAARTDLPGALTEAAFLVDTNCVVRDHNGAAQQLLESGSTLSLSPKGRLLLSPCGWNEWLEEQVARACGAKKSKPVTSARQPSGSFNVIVLPIRDRTSNFSGIASLFPPTLYALVIFQRAAHRIEMVVKDNARNPYRLTAAEQRLVSALLDGRSLSEAAEQFGITRETVRTHLRSIFLKTGTHRQVELVRLLMKVPSE
ncbi:helix-turn-helix transcriptional regulator [Chelatococcus sp. HY11]|uniref:helix-turn-helix transcriptional regulator n=1 Tax=Chelatococcus sp. HY11 TaxID=2835634 RepID=UPI001BCB1411|nr:helix-turn-helix transcriptional regulator [Chelatococcus sp. HY11]MBS7743537.1 helix-turn-helix transcriptional regulator [Chelatococcus sp. HY11]